MSTTPSSVLAADSANNRVLAFAGGAQPASRVLGQTSFSANGPNQIKPGSINAPFKIAVDYSSSPFPIYVSDANNNRVLVWKDSAHFHTGDPADLVIGQPSMTSGAPNADSGGASPWHPTALGMSPTPETTVCCAIRDPWAKPDASRRMPFTARPISPVLIQRPSMHPR